MNKVVLMGRITKDPEVKQTNSGVAVCSFQVAVDRKYKDNSGEKVTDFIACVAWRQQATLLGNYFHKGSRILLVGNLQNRKYEVDGQTRTATEVQVEEIEFVESKSTGNAAPSAQQEIVPVPPMPSADVSDTAQLPFDMMPFDI